ncbi:MAG TPA: DoxX family protein [Steroidobacteraceae bacterium]
MHLLSFASAQPKRLKLRRVGAWALGLYLGWMYVQQGWIKFDPAGFWTAAFARWGYPDWLRVLVGVIEVTGGVCLVVPWLATYGAVGLGLVMVGAWITRARGAHWVDVAWITAYLAGLAWIGAEWRSWRVRFGRGPA